MTFQDPEINKQTINFLKNLLVDDPHNIHTRLQLASLYLQIGEVEKAGVQISFVAKLEPNNRDVLTLQKIFEQQTKRSIGTESDENLQNYSKDNSQELIKIIDEMNDISSSSSLEKPKNTFAEVGGMDKLKEEIRLGIIYPFQKPELYAKYGKKIGGGILLYGPPGCGKTFIARATAGQIQANFISVGIEEILDMYIGQSEKNIHSIFEEARQNRPTVLFFDEIDALSMDRMKSNGKTALVNQFLTELDGISGNNQQLMIIGATNAPWQVDPAFKRPGRFDKVIFVEPPDKIARAEIFKLHLQDKPVDRLDYLKLADLTNLFSGADISKVCDIATESVMREALSGKEERNINMKDLEKAIKETNSSIKEWLGTAKNFARFANESGNYSAIGDFLKRNNIEL
jgi:transitional endoplasmic reticulum ATPase